MGSESPFSPHLGRVGNKVNRMFARRPKPLSKLTYTQHALVGAAFTANMLAANPFNSAAERRAFEWAEAEFNRIARGEVGEADLIG